MITTAYKYFRVIIVAWLFFIPCVHAATETPFKVEIFVDKASLKGDFYKSHGGYFVDTKVTNIGDSDQKITIWTQYGWSWLSDNPVLNPGIEALKNFPTTRVLKPGQDYSAKVEIWSDPGKKSGAVTFRLGFVPNTELPASSRKELDPKWGGPFWSNQVTLD
jgi:hypothetical protein